MSDGPNDRYCPICYRVYANLDGPHDVLDCATRSFWRLTKEVRRLRRVLRRRTIATTEERNRILVLERMFALKAQPRVTRDELRQQCLRCSDPAGRGIRFDLGFPGIPGRAVTVFLCPKCFNLVFDVLNPDATNLRASWKRTVERYQLDALLPRSPSPARTPCSTSSPEPAPPACQPEPGSDSRRTAPG